MSALNWDVLLCSLELAVPLELARLAAQGGASDADRAWMRAWAKSLLGEYGTGLLYRKTQAQADAEARRHEAAGDHARAAAARRSTSAAMFADLARVVAILAHAPGGVTFGDRHWCAGTPDSTGAVCHAPGVA